MIIVRKTGRMQSVATGLKADGRTIAFVPTMGALHKGHLSLVKKARGLGDIVVVSIYVNPPQFGHGEDFQNYPRDFETDKRLLEGLDVEYLFLPADSEIYPAGYSTWVETEGITSILEGRSRPAHFRGVTTIVAKLLNIVQPEFAVFGRKDAQQAIVVRKMVSDLNMPVRIVTAPTVRMKSGLAMSSRNRYLTPEQIERASCIYRGLVMGKNLVKSGVTESARVVSRVRKEIERAGGMEIDYISVNDARTLDEIVSITGEVLISAAVRISGVRLIDNVTARPDR